jgi:hypothetical protein
MGAARVIMALRLLAAAMMAAAMAMTLGGCAQSRNDVAVGIGTAAYQHKPAKPYAYLYLPYAQMATLAYTNEPYLANGCPSAARLRASPTEDNLIAAARIDRLHAAGWSCLFGQFGAIGCPPGRRCVEGLAYHVWRRNGCGEAVIAFRGTDSGDVGDWLSNFRWFVSNSVFDQYDQVQTAMKGVIQRVQDEGCRPRVIIATGHSLGGGLAQHAAFADSRVNYVYAFDPSPVTAFFGVPFPTRSEASEKLGIDRIYESGEVLSLPRYLVSGAVPTSACRPRVRVVRFSTATSASLLERHRMSGLTQGLAELATPPRPAPKQLPTGFTNARNCDFSGNDPEMRGN